MKNVITKSESSQPVGDRVDEFRDHPPWGDISNANRRSSSKPKERDICLNTGTRGNSPPKSSGWNQSRFSFRATSSRSRSRTAAGC